MVQGPLDEVARRLEANLKTARRVTTPLGEVRLGEHVYVRRAAGGVALSATLEAVKGLVFKSSTEICLELVEVRGAASGRPAGIDTLKDVIAAEEKRFRNRLDLEAVVALFSAAGWDDESLRYVRNDPPGSGYAHRAVHLVLVGPAPGDVVRCAHDELVPALRPVLRGRTDDEEEAVARERIERALTLDSYAVLERVTRQEELDGACVERAARDMASRDESLRLENVSGAGAVLRRSE
ncbi:MAG: hypothetical protein ACYTKD_13025 [Planctomycetota bacterium]|jgi:hypothetical protein